MKKHQLFSITVLSLTTTLSALAQQAAIPFPENFCSFSNGENFYPFSIVTKSPRYETYTTADGITFSYKEGKNKLWLEATRNQSAIAATYSTVTSDLLTLFIPVGSNSETEVSAECHLPVSQ